MSIKNAAPAWLYILRDAPPPPLFIASTFAGSAGVFQSKSGAPEHIFPTLAARTALLMCPCLFNYLSKSHKKNTVAVKPVLLFTIGLRDEERLFVLLRFYTQRHFLWCAKGWNPIPHEHAGFCLDEIERYFSMSNSFPFDLLSCAEAQSCYIVAVGARRARERQTNTSIISHYRGRSCISNWQQLCWADLMAIPWWTCIINIPEQSLHFHNCSHRCACCAACSIAHSKWHINVHLTSCAWC